MKVLVIGAGAGTGRQIVEQAIARGHEVTAFVRNPRQYDRDTVRIVVGGARDEKGHIRSSRGTGCGVQHDRYANPLGAYWPGARRRPRDQ